MQHIPVDQSEHRVRDMMTKKVHSANMDDSILEVKRLFDRERCHHVVIMKRRRVHGVVSDRDLLRVVSPFIGNKMMERSQDLNTLKKRVHQIMSRNLVTTTPDEFISVAAKKMLRERVSCLPVVDDDGSVVGIVTLRTFVEWAVGRAGAKNGNSDEVEQDKGILIVIDGNRCYSPDANMVRLVREAERLYDEKNGLDSANARRLPMPSHEAVSS